MDKVEIEISLAWAKACRYDLIHSATCDRLETSTKFERLLLLENQIANLEEELKKCV